MHRIDESLRARKRVPGQPRIGVVNDVEVEIQDHPMRPDRQVRATVRYNVLFPEWRASRVVREEPDLGVMRKVDEFDGYEQRNPEDHYKRNEIAEHACIIGQRADCRITDQIKYSER